MKILTLEPIEESEIPAHNSVFINEVKLSDFKHVLQKNNIASELSGGTLWCANSTLAIRRVSKAISNDISVKRFFFFINFCLFRLIQESSALKVACQTITTEFGSYSMTYTPLFDLTFSYLINI